MFVEKGKTLHYTVGKEIYGPLIAGYCHWLIDECQKLDYQGNVHFALRDAAPLRRRQIYFGLKKDLASVGVYAE